MALANRPDLFIADEPTTALDVTVQAQILDSAASACSKTYGMAMLFITHDLGIVRAIRRRCLRDAEGPHRRGRAMSRRCSRRPSIPTPRRCSPPSPRARRRSRMRTRRCSSPPTISRSGFRSSAASCAARSAISRRSTASRSRCASGPTVGVVGESGSGKTTLGLALLRLIRSEGPIVYLGERIDAKSVAGDAAAAPRHADRLPGPLWLAVAAHVGRRDRRGRTGRADARPLARAKRARSSRRRWPRPGSTRR